jgi:hypothetical protein
MPSALFRWWSIHHPNAGLARGQGSDTEIADFRFLIADSIADSLQSEI